MNQIFTAHHMLYVALVAGFTAAAVVFWIRNRGQS